VDEHKELEDEDPAAELDVEAAEKLRFKKNKKKKDKQAKEEPAPASPRAYCAHAAARRVVAPAKPCVALAQLNCRGRASAGAPGRRRGAQMERLVAGHLWRRRH